MKRNKLNSKNRRANKTCPPDCEQKTHYIYSDNNQLTPIQQELLQLNRNHPILINVDSKTILCNGKPYPRSLIRSLRVRGEKLNIVRVI